MLNNIKMFIDSIRAGYNFARSGNMLGEAVMIKTVGELTIPVYVSDDFITMRMGIPFGAFYVFLIDGSTGIVLSESIWESNHSYVTIAHEIGHIVNGDADRLSSLSTMDKFLSLFDRYLDSEIKADAYAVDQYGGKAVTDALEFFIENINSSKGIDELLERIAHIKGVGA